MSNILRIYIIFIFLFLEIIFRLCLLCGNGKKNEMRIPFVKKSGVFGRSKGIEL